MGCYRGDIGCYRDSWLLLWGYRVIPAAIVAISGTIVAIMAAVVAILGDIGCYRGDIGCYRDSWPLSWRYRALLWRYGLPLSRYWVT